MTGPVEMPVWLVVILVVFAGIGLFDRIFAPSVRWFFRRRLNLAIDQLNERLDTRIQPFRLTRRQAQVERLVFDSRVIEAVQAEAKATGTPRSVVMRRAEQYAREIVPALSLTTYFAVGTRVARWLSELFYHVELGHSDDPALRAIPTDATVVFVINHRSNMDYVLVTYMASKRASLSYAVGEWARVWGLENLIRAMGAYFVRRDSGNELYRRVLGRYVTMATREGVTQAMFPEGGLTRDGILNPAKLGLLGYMVAEFDPNVRDIVFVPVGVNYDRVLEDRILTAKAEREATGRDFRVSKMALIGFLWNLLSLRLRGRLTRFGYAAVSFGTPISLAAWQDKHHISFTGLDKEARFAAVQELADDLMAAIGKIVPALPVSLAAYVFLQRGSEWVGEDELKSAILTLMQRLDKEGANVHIPRADRDEAVDAGIRMLALRHLIDANALGQYRAKENETLILRYYANSIAHLLR